MHMHAIKRACKTDNVQFRDRLNPLEFYDDDDNFLSRYHLTKETVVGLSRRRFAQTVKHGSYSHHKYRKANNFSFS